MVDVPLTLGVEEEYQMVNRSSRGLTSYGQILLEEGTLVLGEQVHKKSCNPRMRKKQCRPLSII